MTSEPMKGGKLCMAKEPNNRREGIMASEAMKREGRNHGIRSNEERSE